MLGYGAVMTDPSFNLGSTEPKDDMVLDMVLEGQRNLFYARSADDDAAHEALTAAGLPRFQRLDTTEAQIVDVALPPSAKPLSRILLSEEARHNRATSLGLSDILRDIRLLLEAVANETGSLPADLSWRKLAFSKEGQGIVYLVPPLQLHGGVGLEAILQNLITEAAYSVPHGNLQKIKAAFIP